MKSSKSLPAIAVLLLIAGWIVYENRDRGAAAPDSPAGASAPAGGGRGGKSDSRSGSFAEAAAGRSDPAASPLPDATASQAESPLKTKAGDRATLAGSTRPRTTVDLTPSPETASPWPDGPRLHAEVTGDTRRYTNLRPNNIGVMPRLQVAAGEILAVKLQLPENSPGDRIYVDLPNGGKFTDSPEPGRIFTLGANRTLEISYQASEQLGNCTIRVRQGGHSRTLPLWAGALPELAEGDETPTGR